MITQNVLQKMDAEKEIERDGRGEVSRYPSDSRGNEIVVP